MDFVKLPSIWLPFSSINRVLFCSCEALHITPLQLPKHLWVKTAKNIKQNDELEAQKLENLNICKYLTSITITITILIKKNQFWWILAVDWMLTDRIGCTVGDPLSLRGTSHQFRWVSLIAADCTLNCHVLKRIKKKAFVYLVFQNLGLHASASSSSSYFERCHVARLLFLASLA